MTVREIATAYSVPSVVNDMGEQRKTRIDDNGVTASIIFPNGWVASVVHERDDKYEPTSKYSVAICDYNGYFDWDILIPFGAGTEHDNKYGSVTCDTENDVCDILNVIRMLKA